MVANAPRRDEGKYLNADKPAKAGQLQQGSQNGALSRAWRKVARAPKRLALSLAALAVFSPVMASAATPAPPQQQTYIVQAVSNAVPDAKKPEKQDYAHSQARLDKIYTMLQQTEAGRELLQFAERENLSIAMSDSKVMDDNPKDRLFTKGLNYGRYILLNGDIKSDDELMLTLVHELRHSWHERGIKTSGLPVTPKQEFLKRRIQEADAFAFEIHFGYEYEKATKKTLDLGNRFENCGAGNTSFPCLAQDYKYYRGKDKPVAEAYSKLLERTIRHVNGLDYDKSFIAQNDNGWSIATTQPELATRFKAKFEETASDAEFVAAMRKVATVGTTPGLDPAALYTWTDADFLSLKKTGGQSKGDVKKLDALEVKFNAARNSWIIYTQAKEAEAAPIAQAPATPQAPEGPSA
ncbi:MAG: DUF6782 family putative metallopeptidase [Alphaproteobacteria bacterium]